LELDQAQITIRERPWGDLLDLSLKVLARHVGALSVLLIAGALPFSIVNYLWLASDLRDTDWAVNPPWLYVGWLIVLIVWETPVVTAGVTLYLGQVLFRPQADYGQLVRDWIASLPQLLFYQVFLRGLMTAAWFIAFLPWVALYCWLTWLNEIILLDRNPFRAAYQPRGRSDGKPGQTTWSRSNAIHSRQVGIRFLQWILATALGAMLTLVIWAAIGQLRQLMFHTEILDRQMLVIWLPVAVWTVVGYFTVVRFLTYLDLRTRTEGWELELLLRAEGDRQARQLT